MQLKNSTDYALRIVCYLAAQERMVSTSELSQKLNISANYIPKIAKKLKNAKIITACEGTNGGYMLAKQPENISLMEIISCVEETIAINRCLEKDRFCSRNLEDSCKIHKVLLSLQNTCSNKLESVKVSDVIHPGKDEYFGRFYVVLKLNLEKKSYECIYSHIQDVYEEVRKTESYEEFISRYIEKYVYVSDKKIVHEFLASESLEEGLVDGCVEKDLPYRRVTGKDKDAYIWIYLCMLCFLLVSLQRLEVFAQPYGSVNIVAAVSKNEDAVYTLPDTTFTMYKVAAYDNGQWELTEEFSKINVSFDFSNPDLQDDTAGKLKRYAQRQGINGRTGSTNSEGKLTFDGLEEGVYLFIQPVKTYLGKSAYQSTAFIIPVPEKDEMGNTMWNITVEPKFKNESLPEKSATSTETTEQHIPERKKKITKGGKTGDNTKLYQWAVLLLLSVLVGEVICCRKNREDKQE